MPTRSVRLVCALLVSAALVQITVARQVVGSLPRLVVSDNKRFLATADGRPFFWLGDTAWERGLDWVLVLDDASKNFGAPGAASR